VFRVVPAANPVPAPRADRAATCRARSAVPLACGHPSGSAFRISARRPVRRACSPSFTLHSHTSEVPTALVLRLEIACASYSASPALPPGTADTLACGSHATAAFRSRSSPVAGKYTTVDSRIADARLPTRAAEPATRLRSVLFAGTASSRCASDQPTGVSLAEPCFLWMHSRTCACFTKQAEAWGR
jgi:hypothetical protein